MNIWRTVGYGDESHADEDEYVGRTNYNTLYSLSIDYGRCEWVGKIVLDRTILIILNFHVISTIFKFSCYIVRVI